MSARRKSSWIVIGLACLPAAVGAQSQSKDQQSCINALNRAAAKIGVAQAKDSLACLKDAASGKLTGMSAHTCLTADRKGKLAKAADTIAETETKRCTEPPDFAYAGSGEAFDGARIGRLVSFTDMFSGQVDPHVLDCDSDRDGCKCQRAGAMGIEALFKAKADAFVKCKREVLATASSAADVAKCIDDAATVGSIAADSAGKIQKAVTALAGKLERTCDEPGVTATAFAGHAACSGLQGQALAECLDRGTSCRVCQALKQIDDLSLDCDLFDNAAADSSCSALDLCYPETSSCDDGNVCTVSDTCTTAGCTGTALVQGTAAAITQQITSIDEQDRVHLLVEIVTVTFKPFELAASDVDSIPGLALESLTSTCATHPSFANRNRCEHTMSFLATSACNGSGDYRLYLNHECIPGVDGCSLCGDARVIDFSLATENWCDVSTVLVCGNGTLDDGEACDGANLDGKSCLTQGYFGGTLACDSDCAFDTSGCQAAKAFITSTVHSGELGGGAGVAGADAICQTRAVAGGLTGTWKAWLSSSTKDARERVAATRYQAMDGSLVSSDGSHLYGGGLAATIERNEFNGSTSGAVWTGTDTDGTRTANVCGDWGSTSGTGTSGTNTNAGLWTNNGSPGACAGAQRLYCLQQPMFKRVFVTSSGFTGNFGGLAGGDAKCQQHANAAKLGGTWRAWLSTASVDAKDRIPDAEYRLVDLATVVAASKADLLDGTLSAPITMDELGARRGSYVWTGSNNDGTSTGGNCNGWMSLAQNIGLGNNVDATLWSSSGTIGACGNSLRLYCFEE